MKLNRILQIVIGIGIILQAIIDSHYLFPYIWILAREIEILYKDNWNKQSNHLTKEGF